MKEPNIDPPEILWICERTGYECSDEIYCEICNEPAELYEIDGRARQLCEECAAIEVTG